MFEITPYNHEMSVELLIEVNWYTFYPHDHKHDQSEFLMITEDLKLITHHYAVENP